MNSLDQALDLQVNELHSLRSTLLSPPSKKHKPNPQDLAPISFGSLLIRRGTPEYADVKILFDTGSSGTLVDHRLCKKLKVNKEQATRWTTASGKFLTTSRVKVEFQLLEFFPERTIKWKAHSAKNLGHDMIIGQDLMQEIGLDILCSKQVLSWDGTEIPFRPRDAQPDTHHASGFSVFACLFYHTHVD